MKKAALVFVALLLLLPFAVSAQVIIDDDFESTATFNEWTRGWGDWDIRGGRLIQRDTDTGLARIDRMVRQSGELEYSFNVRYEAGGFQSQADLRNQQLHAGFGIHVGVENPPLRRVAWGAGRSYLLWLNLDTRSETMRGAREHFGFRGQVYQSANNASMSLTPLNVDIQAELRNIGINLDIADLEQFLVGSIPMKIRVNYDTGRIMVQDPTAPSTWFFFDVDPAVLRGDYVSLRTNSLAVSFGDFSVTRRR